MSIKDKWQGYKDTVSGRNLRKTITPDVKRYNKLREERDEAYDRINPEFFKAEAQYNRYLRGLGGEEAVVNLSPFDSRLHRLNSLERKKDLLAATPHPDYYTYDEEMDKMLENPRTNKEIKDYRKANNRRALAIIGTPVAILGATGATLAAGQGAYNLAKKAIKKRAEDIEYEMEKMAVSLEDLNYDESKLQAAKENHARNGWEGSNYKYYLNDEDLKKWNELNEGRKRNGVSFEKRYNKYRPQSDLNKEKRKTRLFTTLSGLGAGGLATGIALKSGAGKQYNNKLKNIITATGGVATLAGLAGRHATKKKIKEKDEKARNKAMIDEYNADKPYRDKHKDLYEYLADRYSDNVYKTMEGEVFRDKDGNVYTYL